MPQPEIASQTLALHEAKRERRHNHIAYAYALFAAWILLVVAGWVLPDRMQVDLGSPKAEPAWLGDSGGDRLLGYDRVGNAIGPRVLKAFTVYPLPLILGTLIFSIGGIIIGILRSGFFIKLNFIGEMIIDKITQIIELFPAYIAIIMIAWYTTQSRFELGDHWKNLNMAACALAILNIPFFAKVVSRRVSQLAAMDFIEAERAMGLKKMQILYKHIFVPYLVPNLILTAGSFMMELLFMDIGLSYVSSQLGEFTAFPSDSSLGYLLSCAYRPENFSQFSDVSGWVLDGGWYFLEIAVITSILLFSIRWFIHLIRTVFVEGLTHA